MLRAIDFQAKNLSDEMDRSNRIKLLAMLFCAHRLKSHNKVKMTYHSFTHSDRWLFENLSRRVEITYYD